jgi:hypothetical protein
MAMDTQDLFDTLTVRLSDVTRRQDVLRLLGRVALAMLVFQVVPWRGAAQGVTPESLLVPGCKIPGQRCHGSHKCCAGKCDNAHRCGCISKGKSAIVKTKIGDLPFKVLCCTNKLNKRTGNCK